MVGVGSGVVTVALPGGGLIRARGIVIGSIVLEKERAFLKILKGIACWATVFEQALELRIYLHCPDCMRIFPEVARS